MTARDEILTRIRAALADHPPHPTTPRGYARELAGDVDIVALFAERAAEYRATVTVTSTAGLPSEIARAATPHPPAVPTPTTAFRPTDGQPAADLGAAGARPRVVVAVDVPPAWLADVDAVRDDPPLGTSELDRLGVVLTGAAVAIALTGTVVLDAGPAQGRRLLTLLPDRHICVVRTDQIVGTVAQALRRLDPTRPQTWISGPSATSDIELNRVEGVHGPRDLRIIVVRPA